MSALGQLLTGNGLKSWDSQWDPPMPGWQPQIDIAFPSSAGIAVTPDSALRISAFFAGVRLLANTLASLPLIVYEDLPGGGKRRASERAEYDVLHHRANPNMSSFVWRQVAMTHLLTWGNSYSEIVRLDGVQLEAIYPLRPDWMQVNLKNGKRVYTYRNATTGDEQDIPAERLLHIPGLGFDGLVGYSVLNLMRNTLGLARAAEEFGARFFANDARPGVILKHPKTLSQGAVDRLAAQFNANRGPQNAGRTIVMEEGLDLIEVGIPPEDAQFMQTRAFQVADIARWIGVPPHMIGDVDRSTSWGTGIEQQSIGFVVYTMRSWLVLWEQEIRRQVLDPARPIFAEFLVDALLRGDSVARAQSLQIQRQNGVLNADEWREFENRNPLPDGAGQEFWQPMNIGTVNPTDNSAPTIGGLRHVDLEEEGVKCASCGKKFARYLGPGSDLDCPRCKAPIVVAA